MNQAKSASLSPPVIADQKLQDRQQVLTKETGAHNPPLGSDQSAYSYQAQDRQQQAHSAEIEDNTATNQAFNMDMSHSKRHTTHQILSQEVLDENASLARTLVYKSSETSGLVDLYDRMYQENPFEADANFQNLVQQTRALDEKVGQTLLDDLSPMRRKFRKQIRQAREQWDLSRIQEDRAKVALFNDRIGAMHKHHVVGPEYMKARKQIEADILSEFGENDFFGSNLLHQLDPHEYPEPGVALTPQQMQFTSNHLRYQDNQDHKKNVEAYGGEEYYSKSREAHDNLNTALQKFDTIQINNGLIEKGYFGTKPDAKHQARLDDELMDQLIEIDHYIGDAATYSPLPHPELDPSYTNAEEAWKKDWVDHSLDAVDLVSWFMPPAKLVSGLGKGAKVKNSIKAGVDAAQTGTGFYSSYQSNMQKQMENLVRDHQLPRNPVALKEYLSHNPKAFAQARFAALGQAMFDTGNGKLAGKFVEKYNKFHKTNFNQDLIQPVQKSLEEGVKKVFSDLYE